MNSREHDQNQNEIQPKKSGFTKFLIIILLLSVLAGAAWGAVKIVKNFPEAVDSLASIADTVYNHDPKEEIKLSINTDRNVLNTGETVSIWWNEVHGEGDYLFNYTCKEGVTIDLSENEGDEFTSIACNTKHKLNSDGHIKIRIESEEDRFSDVTFSISHQVEDKNISTEDSSKITVVNTSISDSVTVTNDKTESSSSSSGKEESVPDQNNTVVNNENNPNANNQEPKPVEQQPYYTYKIPTSDPNGHTDLVLSNIKTGYINNIGIFIESKTLTTGFQNAIQFTVHNIGTKTSNDWDFKISASDPLLSSRDQTSLKPNERSTLIVQLPNLNSNNYYNLSVLVETSNDANINNNYQVLSSQ